MIKKIWRLLLPKYKNSRFQLLISKFLEKMKFEGFYISYSQFGEDIILENLLREINDGYYVDIGCNRPIEGNNTFKFYLKNWTGINVDGNEKMIDLFNKIRPRDINIPALISNETKDVSFYVSHDDRVSSVSLEFVRKMQSTRDYEEAVSIRTKTLEEIFQKYLKKDKLFAFLTIDVEGHDFEVLSSNEFNQYRPYLVCVENHDFNVINMYDNQIYLYLTSKNYQLVAFSKPNLYFMRNEGR